MQRSWYDVHEEAAGEAEGAGGDWQGGEEFMKMMTALSAQEEEKEQQEREAMDEKCLDEKNHLPRQR
jgi:hypothetical protein